MQRKITLTHRARVLKNRRAASPSAPPRALANLNVATAGRLTGEPMFPAGQPKRLMGTDSAQRKHFPITSGLLDYFPDSCAAVSEISFVGNKKHNPGEAMHHSRGKS